MVQQRFFNQLYKSFKSIGGFALTLIGVAITIAVIKYQEQIKVNFWFVIIIIFLIILVITFFDSALYYYKSSLNRSPKVYKVITREDNIILLTEYSDYLQMQGLVTVYWLNDDFEETIGYGEVINIQNDKKIQISLFKLENKSQSLEEIRKSILVKPHITLKTIEI